MPNRPAVATFVAAILSAACSPTDPSFDLKPFSSCEALEASIKDQAMTEIRWDHAWGGFQGGFAAKDVGFAMSEESVSSSDSGGGARSAGHSSTNVQVEGVDELDLMETDGEYIFAIAADHLVASKVWPPEEAAVASKLKVEGVPKGIFLLASDQVILVSQIRWGEDGYPLSGQSVQGVDDGMIKVTILDVTDPSEMSVLRETYSRGILYDARMKEDRLFTVAYLGLGIPALASVDGKRDKLNAVRKSVLSDWMPLRYDSLRAGPETDWSVTDGPLCDCENVYGSKRNSGDYLVSVQSLDVSDPMGEFVGSAVLGWVDHIYASQDSIYVVSSEHAEGPWSSYDDSVDTIVHRFKVDEASGVPAYQSSGKVPGYTLNQFSLDQKGDTLRIATTKSVFAGGNGESNLYVLEDDGDEMDIIGAVEGLAAGEQIYAVRYVDDVAYVVTYRQTDPLFTIDLADPTAPKVRGELHITGFSNYLHPLADGSLLGIGLDMDEQGFESFGVQVSHFDVSDLDDPKLSNRITLENTSWSEAQDDHHAFNFYAPTESLSIPAHSWESDQSLMYVISAGVDVELGIKGTLSREGLLASGWESDGRTPYCTDFQRSVVIEGDESQGGQDTIYGLSNAGIVAASVSDLSSLTVELPYDGIDPCAVTWGSY